MNNERFEVSGDELNQVWPTVVKEFFALTPHTGNSELFDQQTELQKRYSEQADAWHSEKKMEAWNVARGG